MKKTSIRSDVGLDKHFLKSLRILVGILPGPAVLFVFSVLRSLQHLPLLWVIRKKFLFGFFK